MAEDSVGKPTPPDLPKYLREPLEKQSPERLDAIATYARKLAEWRRKQREMQANQRREEEAVDDEELKELNDRDISTDSAEYEDVPASGAYITIKETKPGYRYYYWQWRDGDSWKNEYIAPVNPKEQ